MFQVGQLVLCRPNREVDPPGSKREPLANYPTPGRIYTVRAVNEWPSWTAVRLEEVDNSHLAGRRLSNGTIGRIEPGFNARHFVPVRDDRLSIFRQHLAPVDKVLT